MRPTGRLAIAVIVLAIVFQASDVTAQLTRADYDRAIGLREAYQALVTNVPDAAVWIGETSRFWYRRSVAGGHEFVMMDAATQQKRQPFDHQRLAAALSSAAGGSWTGVTLPFNTFRFADEERATRFRSSRNDGPVRLLNIDAPKVSGRSRRTARSTAWRQRPGARTDHNDNQRWRVAPVALRPSAAPSG